tara:strand:- start:1983 stop:2273 length:291 start_codon:yes stop_codon:yes gene_type:complete
VAFLPPYCLTIHYILKTSASQEFKTDGFVGSSAEENKMEQNDRWTPAKKALVEYKCVVCGHFQSFTKDSNDMHCAKCGGKIFVKPRRTSVKELDAI